MAIRIIEGVPGSGKTYFAVHHLLTKYFDFDKKLSEWKKKSEFKNLVLVTNIDGFPFATSLDSLIETAGSLEAFFTYEYQEKLSSGTPYVYLIDECQGLFPFTYRDTRVFLFFQKHRHLGMDIYLLTQDADHLAKGLRNLSEFHIVASRRSFSLVGELRYRFVDPQTKECWQTKVLKKEGRIFSFYRSFSALETEKSSSVPRRFMALVVLSIVFILVVGYFGLVRRLRGRDSKMTVAGAVQKESPTGSFLFGGNPKSGLEVSHAQGSMGGSSVSSLPNSTAFFARVVGVYSFSDESRFLVSFNGAQFRVDRDEMTAVCRCHVAGVVVDRVYQVDLTFAPAAFRSALVENNAGLGSRSAVGGKVTM